MEHHRELFWTSSVTDIFTGVPQNSTMYPPSCLQSI